MSNEIHFDVKFVPAGTGSVVWDNPHAEQLIQRFMPYDRKHGPMIGILDIAELRPTPAVLRDVVVTVGEDIKAGRYGDFSFFISCNDADTQSLIGDLAKSRNIAVFLSTSTVELEGAEPVGALTTADYETLELVREMGGTITALGFSNSVGIEKTAAGNRLSSLHRKGFLQRVERPHPAGDLYADPRSVSLITGDSENA